MKRRKPAHLPLVSLSRVAELASASHGEVPEERTVRPGQEGRDPEAPCRQKWARRHDAPVINYSRGASKWKARHVFTEEEKRSALDAYERDFVAASARGPACSVIRTWESMHISWFGGEPPPWPLTPAKIRAVGSIMKARGYRSFGNYATKAKMMHIQLTGDWPAILDQEMRMAKRSVGRGLGPSRQSQPILIIKLAVLPEELLADNQARVLRGPIGSYNMIVLSVYFMLREIESSLSLCSSVEVDEVALVVRWLLPSSKCDPLALNTTREWGCTCKANGCWLCPYHAAYRQRRMLVARFADSDGSLPPGLPFFPTEQGGTVEREAVVETYKAWHRAAGIAVVDGDGAELLGGHSARTGGAVLLAQEGVHLYQIELLARWRSPMLLHYARTAPLTTLTQDYVKAKNRQRNA
eukprot:s2027_g7.t1